MKGIRQQGAERPVHFFPGLPERSTMTYKHPELIELVWWLVGGRSVGAHQAGVVLMDFTLIATSSAEFLWEGREVVPPPV